MELVNYIKRVLLVIYNFIKRSNDIWISGVKIELVSICILFIFLCVILD